MDIWESLIGAPPQGPEETQRIAQQLRRNAEYGLLGQLTGDRVLAPAGQGMRESSFKKAGSLQKALQEQQRRALTEKEGVLNRTLQQRMQDERIQHERGAYTPLEVGEGGAYIPTNPYTGATRPEVGRERPPSGGNGLGTKELLGYTRDLSRDLEAAKLPEIDQAVAQVDLALQEYKEGNIPGIGGGKFDPRAEARAMRGRLAPIRNILLLARSGAAVTEQEYERFKEELLGESWRASDEDFRRAWGDLKSRIEARRGNIFRGYHPSVVDFYANGTFSDMDMVDGRYEARTDPNSDPATNWRNQPGSVMRGGQRNFEADYADILNPRDEEDEDGY